MSDTNELITQEFEIGVFHSEFSSKTEEGIPIKKLYVYNISRDVTKEDLYSVFCKYGEVWCTKPIKVGYRAYAFITFSNENDALQARLAAKDKEIICRSRAVKITPARTYKQPDNINVPKKMYRRKKKRTRTRKQSNNIKLINTPINMLDDDCLIKIFSYLPIHIRLLIERVCKRWKAVILHSWSDIKELTINKYGYLNVFRDRYQISDSGTVKLLNLCGRFLKILSIDGCRLNIEHIIPAIADNCHNLKHLTLFNGDYPKHDMDRMFRTTQKLSTIHLLNRNIVFSTGDYLKNLPIDTIEEITILFKDNYQHYTVPFGGFNDYDLQNFQEMKKLWKLETTYFSYNFHELKSITDNKTLCYLNLSNCILNNNANLITNLHGLKYLVLRDVREINDNFLDNLAENCPKIQYLDISRCRLVTNVGMNAIAKLKRLETLKINTIEVSDVVIKKFTQLKVLHCDHCSRIYDTGMSELVKNSKKLEELYAYETSITIDFLHAAFSRDVDRVNPHSLKIVVSLDVYNDWCEAELPHSFLIVQTYDHCVDDISSIYDSDNESLYEDVTHDLEYIDYYEDYSDPEHLVANLWH